MAYATITEVEAGYRALNEAERAACPALLDEAAVIIDAYAEGAAAVKKNIVSCRMVRRAIASFSSTGSVPMGATQGSMTAGPYTQSWTLGSGSSAGELYLSRTDKNILGIGNRIGSYSPLEGMVVGQDDQWN